MFRAGQVCPTAGWAPGFTQTNLIAVPADWAYESSCCSPSATRSRARCST